MQTKWLDTIFEYDGTQLRSLFAYLEHGILGDSVVAWRGPCKVDFEHMVDGEDLRARDKICGGDMIHFIVETFDTTLFSAVAFQRLIASLAKEKLENESPMGKELKRSGDDLYWREGKLSISIATQSPTSSLIHFAMNVSNEGTPVKTASLEELNVSPEKFSQELLLQIAEEFKAIRQATQKVRWVR